jgi:hypothetical protein
MTWHIRNRVVLAAIVAPLFILILIPAVMLLASKGQGQVSGLLIYSGVRLALMLLPFASVLMLIVGVPLFLILRRYGVARIWTAAAVGFGAVFIFPAVFALLSAATDRHPTATFWAYAFDIARLAFIPLLTLWIPLVSAIVGAIFCVIAKPTVVPKNFE